MSDVEEKAAEPVAEPNGEAGEGRAKRARKSVEFFKPAAPVAAPAGLVIKEGTGEKIGDIANVKFLLSKYKNDDDLILHLHHFLFKSKGQAHQRKKHIFEFSGFVDEGDKEAEAKKRHERLNKWSVDLLNRLLDSFELPRGSGPEGHKSEKVSRALAFLDAPKPQSDKDLAAEAEKKKEKARKQREKQAAKKAAPTKKRKTPSKAKDDEEGSEEESEGEHEPEEEEEAEEEAAEEQPAKKKAKKEAAVKKSTPKAKAATPKAKAEAKPKAAAKPKAKAEAKPKKGKEGAKKDVGAKSPAAKKKAAKAEAEEAEGEDEEVEERLSDTVLRDAVREVFDGAEDPGALSKKQLLEQLKEKLGVSMKPYKGLVTQIALELLEADKGEEAQPPAAINMEEGQADNDVENGTADEADADADADAEEEGAGDKGDQEDA